jgi:hypothetical protein
MYVQSQNKRVNPVMVATVNIPLGTFGSLASLLAAKSPLYQGYHDRNYKFKNIVSSSTERYALQKLW